MLSGDVTSQIWLFMKFHTRPLAQKRLDKTKFNLVDVNHLRLLTERMQNLQRYICTALQMIPVPQMIPKLDHKWSQDQKWCQDCTANDPRTETVSSPQMKEMSGLKNLDSGFISPIFVATCLDEQ